MDEREIDGSANAAGWAQSDDDSFLDELYERALTCFELGQGFDPAPWLSQRVHLEQAIESAIELAREVATSTEGRPRKVAAHIAGYALERELGHGAMGSVYLARQENLGGRRVALKVLAHSASFSARARARFLREARALAKVRHAHVVPVHDVVEDAETCAYSMEWIEGASLERVLRGLWDVPAIARLEAAAAALGAPRPLAAESWTHFVLRAGRDLARALAAVHAAGLLHRDVKPANVLLRTDGTVLLTDFSLVHDPDDALVTRTGQFVGTPAYAAPEQLRGEGRAVDARSDVFGLGATLFEALTLRRPFEGRTPAELLGRMERGGPPRLRRFDTSLARDLETILAKCLEADPDGRYATASELADDLERLLRLEPIQARPAGLLERSWKWLQREKRRTLAALLGAALALVPAVWLAQRGLARLQRDSTAGALHRQAELALLTPDVDGPVFETARDGRKLRALIEGRVALKRRLTLAEVLDARALSQGPSAKIARVIEVERHVLSLAKALAAEEAPLGGAGARLYDRAAHSLYAGEGLDWLTDEELARAAPEDRRGLGLLLWLTDRDVFALRSWAQVPAASSDPFLAAALGRLHLARDQAAEAFPLLTTACAAYPEVGFLRVLLADAAVRIGELERADQALAESEGMDLPDTLEATTRVRAELLAARGQDAEAQHLFQELIQRRNGPSPFLRFARFLESRGRGEEALGVRRTYADRRPDSVLAQMQFLEAAHRWWSNLGGPAWRRLDSLLATPEREFGSLFTLFPSLLSAEQRRARMDPASAYEPEESTLPPAATSSSESESPSLLELAQRMETMPMYPQVLTRSRAPIRSLSAVALCAEPRPPLYAMLSLGLALALMARPTSAQFTEINDPGAFCGAAVVGVDPYVHGEPTLMNFDLLPNGSALVADLNTDFPGIKASAPIRASFSSVGVVMNPQLRCRDGFGPGNEVATEQSLWLEPPPVQRNHRCVLRRSGDWRFVLGTGRSVVDE